MSDSAHDSVEGFFYWKQRAEAVEAERDRQRGAAEKHYARSESLLEQLTERDVALDRAVLKLAEAQAEVGRLEKAHAYSEASYFAAENALTAERAKVADLELMLEKAIDNGALLMLDRMEAAVANGGKFSDERANRFVAAEARTAKLVEALEVAREQARLGYVLSTYAASIHWDRSKNTPEWMAGLRERIELVQAAAKASE